MDGRVEVGIVVRSWFTAVATSPDEGVAGFCCGRLQAEILARMIKKERNRRKVFIGQLRNEKWKSGLPQTEPIRGGDNRAGKDCK
jgi:hypothetical protein